MPEYSGGERLFTFHGLTKNNHQLTTKVRASSYAESVRQVGNWGIHSATHVATRYLEGVERTNIALFEISEDPFLGSRWTVAIDGINRATTFSLGGNELTIRFLANPREIMRPARPTIRVRASRTGAARVWIGPPSVIAPADGNNAALLMELGWAWRHGSVSSGFTMDLAPGWSLPHALHLAVRALLICGAIDDESHLHVSGECVVRPTVIGWWTDRIEHGGHVFYRIPQEWPPPPRHPSQQKKPKHGATDKPLLAHTGTERSKDKSLGDD